MVDASSYSERPHILVVDDDDRLRDLLRRYLAEQGFVVATAREAREALELLKNLAFDLMVLDVMMPGMDGFALTKKLREADDSRAVLPILLLTARGETEDRIQGLEAGADDYLAKPFEPKELLLRINAILRRVAKVSEKANLSKIKIGRWVYDPARDVLEDGDEVVRLTDVEAGLLKLLAADPGKPLSREVLAERSHGAVNDRTIDVQVTRLRRKIEKDPKNPIHLLTIRGEGYMLVPGQEGQGA